MVENILSPSSAVKPAIRRTESRAFLTEDGSPQPIEYFLASDPSAIVEHTKRVLYLEDNDIAHICEGGIHLFDKISIFIDFGVMMEHLQLGQFKLLKWRWLKL